MRKPTFITRLSGVAGKKRKLILVGIALVGALGLTAAVSTFAAGGTHPSTVYVNPRGMSPGHVTVQIYGGACNENVKTVGPDGSATFGGCPNGKSYTAAVHQDQFTRDGQVCTIQGSKTQPANNNATFTYGCAPQSGGGGGGGGGGAQKPPDRAPTTMRVWVNPHPALAGTEVTVNGAGCGGRKGVRTGGWADFAGCRIGDEVTVTVPKTRTVNSSAYEVPDNQRKFNVRKNEVVTFNYDVSEVAYLSGSRGCSPKGVEYRNQIKHDTTKARKRQFGNPGTNLVSMYFMGEQVTVHKRVAPCLQAVENELRAHGNRYNVYRVDSYAPVGSGQNKPWQYHPYGAGIDINPPENPQCPGVDLQSRCGDRKPYKLPDWWVPIFQKYGFWWGGYYQHSAKDYMHFEFHR